MSAGHVDHDSRPAVSAIVPCFGRAELLGECLHSLSTQTFPNWECIVVDDGTPDDSIATTVDSCDDPRVRLIRRAENGGTAAGRNTGIAAALAPLVLPLDSDDRLAASFFERTLAALDEQPDADCAYTDFQLFGDTDAIYEWPIEEIRDLASRQWIPGPGVVIRRTLWQRAGGYCESEELRVGDNEDWDFWIAAAETGLRAIRIAEPLYLHRKHAGSYSAQNLLRHEGDTRHSILHRHRRFFTAHGGGRRFVAAGYLISSVDAADAGDRWSSLSLAGRGWLLRPGELGFPRLMAAALTPRALLRLRRR